VSSIVVIAFRVHAQCPATLSVLGPDANGIVTVISGTSGSCGTTSLHLTLDGGNLDETTCQSTQCQRTTTIDAKCLGAYDGGASLTHVVGLTTTCSTGGPVCVSAPNGTASGEFTIAPTPTIHVDPGTLDEKGKGTATVTYSFPYNASFGDVRLAFDNHCCVTCGFCTHPEGTWVVPYSFTCGDPGPHTLEAQAFTCNGVNPSFIAKDTESVEVQGQTTVHGSYDEDAKTLTVTSHFANTETAASGQRSISAFVDGRPANFGVNGLDCVAQVTNSCVVNLSLSCGTPHVIRLVANGCGRPEPMYNGEDSVFVTPICSNDTQCRHSPSTSQDLGAMLDSQNSGESCDLCPAQPVHVGSGDVSITLPLFTIAGSPMSLPFTLTYHSLKPSFAASLDYPLGPGWTHPYNMSVRPAGGGARLQYFTPTGNRLYFDQATPNLWIASRPAFITDTITKDDAAGTYAVNYVNGGKSLFSIATGKWLSTVDRWGNSINATYEAAGNLTAITDPEGRQVTLAYSNDLVSRISLPNGASWTFTYTALGPRPMLTAINDPVNSALHWRTFEYVVQSDGVFRSLSAMRDSAGKLIEGHNYEVVGDNRGFTSFSEGDKNHYFFDFGQPSPNQTRVTRDITDSISQVTIYTLQNVKGSYSATQIDGVCTSCSAVTDSQTKNYDPKGRLLSVTDAAGLTTRYAYDSFGNILTKTEAAGTPRQRITTYAYEDASWPSFMTKTTVPSATGSGSRVLQRQWNPGETLLTTTDGGFTETTTFDSRHRVIRQDGRRTDVADVTARSYFSDSDPDLNRRGRLQQVTAPPGLTTSYDNYDVYGTSQRTTDANGVVSQLQTDLRGRVTSTTLKAVPGDPNETADYVSSTVFDARDRVAEITTPRGARMRYGYEDGTNALTDTVRVDFSGNEVERKHLTLNKADNKIAEEDQLCAAPAPSCASWITKRSASFVYDVKDRLVEIDQPVPAGAKIVYRYDANGRLQGVQDENHSAPNTTYAYDELSRLASVTQGPAVIRYDYDAQSNLSSATDPNGNVTAFVYDDFGRVLRQASPVTGVTTYSYDPAGNLIATTDANGATTTRTFDAANRVVSSTSTRGGAASETVTWIYDDPTPGNYGLGRLATMTDPTGTTARRYERRGLVRSEEKTIEGSSYTTIFKYDAARNRIQMTYPSGRVVTATFDFADRPLAASLGAMGLVSATAYAPFGPMTRIALGNGTVKSMELDSRYRPLENKLSGPAGLIADYVYAEDPAGNIRQIHDGLDPAFNRDFAYDELNRLVSANSGSGLWGSGSYAYDPMGNVTSLTLGRSATFSYLGSTPKLASVTENGATRSVAYDSAGNESAVGNESFTYTSRNSLGGSFAYDGRGVRTITFVQGSLDSLSISQGSVTGGGSFVTGSVNITSPATSDVAIGLSADPPAVVPPSVVVPAGSTTATFTILTRSVTSDTAATITATAAGVTRTAMLTILAPVVSALELTPSAVVGGGSSTATVSLSGAAATDIAVSVTRIGSTSASAPPQITVSAGQSSGSFTISTVAVATSERATFTVSANRSSASSTLTIAPQPVVLGSLSLQPSSVVGGLPSTGVLTLTSAAPAGGATVALSSSDTSLATVPSSVIVPAGATTSSFNVDTASTLSTAAVTISAAYNAVAQTAVLTVTPPSTLSLFSLYVDPINVAGGTSSIGTVVLSGPAPNGGADVALTSSDMTVAAVPSRVRVKGGDTSATFTINTFAVTSTASIAISGSFGQLAQQDVLTVIPITSIRLLSLSLSPVSVTGGGSLTGTVVIDSAAPPGGIAVSLSSKQKKLVAVPGTVTIPGGATSAGFVIATKSVRRTETADINASWAGVTKTATLTISPAVSLWRTLLAKMERRQKLSLSVTAEAAVGAARRYSIYSPELRLIAESETTSATTPRVAYEYIWFNGQPLAQVSSATGEVSWYFDDHLSTPILQTNANGSVVWRVEREPYGARYAVRAGGDRYQPLALPGQEEDATGERSYNVYRWYRSGWGRYTQADPIGIRGGYNLFQYGASDPIDAMDPLGLEIRRCFRPFSNPRTRLIATVVGIATGWSAIQPPVPGVRACLGHEYLYNTARADSMGFDPNEHSVHETGRDICYTIPEPIGSCVWRLFRETAGPEAWYDLLWNNCQTTINETVERCSTPCCSRPPGIPANCGMVNGQLLCAGTGI